MSCTLNLSLVSHWVAMHCRLSGQCYTKGLDSSRPVSCLLLTNAKPTWLLRARKALLNTAAYQSDAVSADSDFLCLGSCLLITGYKGHLAAQSTSSTARHCCPSGQRQTPGRCIRPSTALSSWASLHTQSHSRQQSWDSTSRETLCRCPALC